MKKTPYFLIIINIFWVFWKRLWFQSRFQASVIQRVSLLASLELYERGRMRLGYNLCVSALCNFQVLGRGELMIGDRVFFNRGCMISCHQKVTIGKGCIFGPDVKIYDNDHCFSSDGLDHSQLKLGTISIGEGTWVAANVVLLRDTHIGKHCVIGAGAVVKGNVPDHSLVTANRSLTINPIQ